MIPASLRALTVVLMANACMATAAAGSPAFKIAWPHPHEALQYHSCGCGDACWVAEVVDTTRHVVKARLLCDCENLTFSASAATIGAPTPIGRCTDINDSPDKFTAIRGRLEELVSRPTRHQGPR